MLRKLLKSKIHRATVTRSDLNYEGSIAIDTDLLQAADIQPFEAVHVWNVSNGSRLQTYALPSTSGSGEICLNGAAARHAQAGDLVIVASFSWMDEKETSTHKPKLIFVDGTNRHIRKDDLGNHGAAAKVAPDQLLSPAPPTSNAPMVETLAVSDASAGQRPASS